MSAPTDTPWLVRMSRRTSPRVRLVCLPHAGGGASAYRPWLQALPPHVALDAVQLPGRESRFSERLRVDLHALADELAGALSTALLEPFALLGHSMGAILAYEVAQRLVLRGGPVPRRLFVSGHRAPHLPAHHPQLHRLSDDALLSELGRKYGGIPAAVLADAELRALYVPILRADLTAVETYAPRAHAPLPCPVVALGGSDDPGAAAEELQAWSAHTSATFSAHLFEGGHFFLQPRRAEVVALVVRELERDR